MSRLAQALQGPLFAPAPATTRAAGTRPGARFSPPAVVRTPTVPNRRLRLVSSSLARPTDRPAFAALLLDLDRRRRRAQIAARHALDG